MELDIEITNKKRGWSDAKIDKQCFKRIIEFRLFGYLFIVKQGYRRGDD